MLCGLYISKEDAKPSHPIVVEDAFLLGQRVPAGPAAPGSSLDDLGQRQVAIGSRNHSSSPAHEHLFLRAQ